MFWKNFVSMPIKARFGHFLGQSAYGVPEHHENVNEVFFVKQ